jgi:hypothetical protein
MPRHSKDGICFKEEQSWYRERQTFMHFCLAVLAAAKMVEALSASRALSGPELSGKSATKSMTTTVNDGPLHFMARPPDLKSTTRFGVSHQSISGHCGLGPTSVYGQYNRDVSHPHRVKEVQTNGSERASCRFTQTGSAVDEEVAPLSSGTAAQTKPPHRRALKPSAGSLFSRERRSR